MNFKNQDELYQKLIPVLNIKIKIAKYYKKELTKEEIWNYLKINKWTKSKNLKLSDIVNDIILANIYEI